MKIGEADDRAEADGQSVFNWKQALDSANQWFDSLDGTEGAAELDFSLTVREAVEIHISERDEKVSERVGRPVRSTASFKLGRYVLCDEKLCGRKLIELSEGDLKSWQRRLKGIKGTTKARVVTDLKAALNAIYEEKRRLLPNDFAVTVKHGLKPTFTEVSAREEVARENQVLEDAQIRQIVQAAREHDEEGDFALLVLLLAATGARFSQLARMRVCDVQFDQARLMVPPSSKGRGKAKSYIRIQVGQDVLMVLRGFCEGRRSDAILLERWHHRQTGPMAWQRTGRQGWKTPSEMRRPWIELMEKLSLVGVIPYSLRHSSIVRGLRVGLPIRLVAAKHDTSVAMIERHYARWISDSLDDLSMRAIVNLI
ncbi:tyrosine-type recombinase/integrase [Sphingobium baderi]|uniref:tyrosine-type recombinase/integrase n=1 Tax=Sphingobium baderi TaxID=1332080 RepID=UPI002B403C5B|nr:tyrosine-type recombinase/integrase [Sphingobium baderi]WRD77051.1 tyrosine-type recombinase/integrase [Sphingobium baderi]